MPRFALLVSALLLTRAVYPQTPEPDPTDGLIGHYLLDGDDTDHSGYLNHALAVGTYTSDRDGNPNAALRLSENGHYILFPDIITLSEPEWTYSLWLKPEKLASEVSDMFLLSLADVEVWDDIHLFIDDTGDEFKTWYASHITKRSTGVKAETGEWYHVAISSAADDTVRIYVNGVRRLSHRINYTSTGNSGMMLSSLVDDPSHELKGRFFGVVDDIRIYGRAISDDEVATLHDPLWNYVPEPEVVYLLNSLIAPGQPITLFSNTTVHRVVVYDVRGRKVHETKPLSTDQIPLFLPRLATGMYVVHAYTDNTLFKGKVMVVG